MGTLFGFAVGYVIGARAGSEGFDEVVDALRALRESEEARAFVQVLRGHLRGSAAVVGAWMTNPPSSEDLVARAKERVQRRRR